MDTITVLRWISGASVALVIVAAVRVYFLSCAQPQKNTTKPEITKAAEIKVLREFASYGKHGKLTCLAELTPTEKELLGCYLEFKLLDPPGEISDEIKEFRASLEKRKTEYYEALHQGEDINMRYPNLLKLYEIAELKITPAGRQKVQRYYANKHYPKIERP